MDGEKPGTPSGQAEGGLGGGDGLGAGWIPPDLQMTDQFRVIEGDEAALPTAPDRPAADATGPQGSDAQPGTPRTAGACQPVPGPPAPIPSRPLLTRRRARRPGMLIATVAGMLVIALGASVAYLSRSGTSTRPTAAGSRQGSPGAGQDQRGRPSGGVTPNGQNGTVPAPRIPSGRVVSYATVQRVQGYFEGMLTLTNRTGAPMTKWEMSFSYPGAYVKNIWGGVLVQAGPQAILRNESNAAPIPVGGTVQVRVGAAGSPSTPQNCLLNGGPC